jgi:hypothetical protein
MSAFGVVFRKECVDNLRDRRALTTALVMPLLGPLMLVAVFFALKEAEAKSRAPQIAVVGAEHAPELITWLGQQGVEVKAPPADPEEAVRTGGPIWSCAWTRPLGQRCARARRPPWRSFAIPRARARRRSWTAPRVCSCSMARPWVRCA